MWGRSEDRVRRAPGPEWGAPLIIGGPGGVPLSIHHPHPPIHPRIETRHVRRYLTWIQVVRWIGCAFWPLEVCNRGTFDLGIARTTQASKGCEKHRPSS